MKKSAFIKKVTIDVGFRSPGGSITNRPIAFDVSVKDGHYAAIPICNEFDRRLADLPEALEFVIKEKTVQSLRGIKDGNMNVIQDIVATLRKEGVTL